MMQDHTRIKICGITNPDDGLLAARLGVDFIGMIFFPPSPRYLAPPLAAAVLHEIRATAGDSCPRAIGVFVDEKPENILKIRERVELDGVQLAGDEPPQDMEALPPLRFRGISLRTLDRLGRYQAEAYLCDTHAPEQKGGTGRGYDYDLLRPCIQEHRIIIAGGLTPERVGDIVVRLRPWGVDVSSSLETAPGVKNPERVRAFVQAVHQADEAIAQAPPE